MQRARNTLLVAAALGLSSCSPLPAHANVSTAAWTMAFSVCKSLSAGLSVSEAARVGIRYTMPRFPLEMGNPAFFPLMAERAQSICPEVLFRAGGQQL